MSILEKNINELKASRDTESKSSVGDKYETGRSMIQMEMDQVNKQLSLQKEYLIAIDQINPKNKMKSAELGALVETNEAFYLISCPIGVQNVNGANIFCISPNSPIAQAMLGKKTNDSFIFRNQEQTLISIS